MANFKEAESYPHRDLTEKIIGAAFEVHRELGAGFLEKVYETALLRELEAQGVRADCQAAIPVYYKGSSVGTYYADMLIDGSVICEKVSERKGNEGYNAATDVYEDLVKAGVIDPTKVVRSALQNAASIASLLLTTEAMVSEIPEEKKEAPAGGPGGMGGMY